MLRLELPNDVKDSGLALPESTPKTLVQIEGENLPYACQCPCCGSLFNIPEGLLYKIEEDTLIDGDLGAEAAEGEAQTDIDVTMGEPNFDEGGVSSSTQESSTTSSATGVGESDDTFV